MRTLEDQMNQESVKRLRACQLSLQEVRIRGRVSSYYIMEISRCIDGGMLLAAIELSTTLIEIWLRDLLVVRKATTDLSVDKHDYILLIADHDHVIEGGESRGLNSNQIISELNKLGVLHKDEIEWLKEFFYKVRNPVHHGLSGKLLNPRKKNRVAKIDLSKEERLLQVMFCDSPENRLNSFEAFLDREAVDIVENVVRFLRSNKLPNGA